MLLVTATAAASLPVPSPTSRLPPAARTVCPRSVCPSVRLSVRPLSPVSLEFHLFNSYLHHHHPDHYHHHHHHRISGEEAISTCSSYQSRIHTHTHTDGNKSLTADGVSPSSASVLLQSPRVYCFLQTNNPLFITHNIIPTLPTHLGNVVENSTLSTLTANVCPARNSPTSLSAESIQLSIP